MTSADWSLERQARKLGFERIAGVDEAGRGCLAGPVAVAAVILDERFPAAELDDSKRLTAAQREHWYDVIRRYSRAIGFATAAAGEIDRVNILEATRRAMRRAILDLSVPPDLLMIDAVRLAGVPHTQVSITRGDEVSVSIAAASIIAKVERDRMMIELDRRYPGFGFGRNKGYPTAEHRRSLRRRGPSPVHRRSFRPVRELCGGGDAPAVV
jgi:ribonuclease HII